MLYLALVFSMMFWGISFIWTKMAFEFYKPMTIIFFRLIISSIFLHGINIFLKKLKTIEKKDYKWFVLLSFLQPFLYFIGESNALLFVSSTVASVLISLIPLFTPFVGYYFFKEKVTLMNVVGIFISITGVIMVTLNNDFSFSVRIEGILLLTLSIFTSLAYSVMLIKLANKYDVYTVITKQNTIGILWFLPIFLIFDINDFMNVGFHLKPFISIIELAILPSSLAYILYTYGMQQIGITKANTLVNTIPVFTAVFAYFLLGETITKLNIIGIMLAIVGVFFSQMNHGFFARIKLFFFRINNN